jgi:hypothetical protein
MAAQLRLSVQTRRNWLIDAAVFVGGVIATLSGLYFLFLPSGGYRGGRNPMYGVTILFERHTWDAAHTWGGVLMIAAVAVHLALHRHWVSMMSKRIVNSLRSGGTRLSSGARLNVIVDTLIAASFFLTAVSGLYFLFAPSGGHASGARVVWDLAHTWSGIVLVVAAVAHLVIHWRWVKNVTRRAIQSALPSPARRGEALAES